MYPHQLLMEEHNLQEKELSAEAKGYIKDFNNFLKGVKLKDGIKSSSFSFDPSFLYCPSNFPLK